MRGKFIVFEGADGSGKTSHVARLAEYLKSVNVPYAVTFEPTDGEIGLLLRKFLKGESQVGEKTVAALFLADRLDHITKKGGLLDLLSDGVNVICDRYYLSSVAYNCPSESTDFVISLNKAATDILVPDLTVYLTTPIERMTQRISNRKQIDVYETIEYQRKVKQRYEEGLEKANGKYVVINTDRDKFVVAQEIRTAVKILLES